MPPAGTVYIENLGCAKNQVDAETMGNRLTAVGWEWTHQADRATLILVNTCGFIEDAQQESIDVTLQLLAEFPDTPVALTGCLAQRFANDLADGMPEIAGVFGNRDPARIDEFVARLGAGTGTPVIWLPEGASLDGPHRHIRLSTPRSAYIKVAEGCDHHCSFCAIPAIRGALRMRPADDILAEFRRLRVDGVFEFNLIAQDLAAWRDGDGHTLEYLLRRLLAEDGRFWIRLLYLYPDTFPDGILRLAQDDPRLVPYFDLSFQHAASRVLHHMGRPGDAALYLDLIARIRSHLPDVALRSSFIVGFPGETDTDVAELEAFLEAATLEWVGVFTFSPQEGTAAARSSRERVSRAVAEERRTRIADLQAGLTADRLRRFVGRRIEVLVEEPFPADALALGRSSLQAPDVDGLVVLHGAAGVRAGDVVQATVTGVTGVDLQAQCLPARAVEAPPA